MTFPYEVDGRLAVPIDYRRTDLPEPSRDSEGAVSACLDAKAQRRLDMVKRWQSLCASHPESTRAELARRAMSEQGLKCGVRTLQLWASKYETGGDSALADNYDPRPRSVLSLDRDRCADAVKVCAWWAFRIGRVNGIDSSMIHSAASIVTSCRRASAPSRLPAADVFAAIDCYYAYPCDRAKMPFKPFARWAKYDFEKWLFRACDENDYRRAMFSDSDPARSPEPSRTPEGDRTSSVKPKTSPTANSPGEEAESFRPVNRDVPLQTTTTVLRSPTPDVRARKRDVHHRANRRAIRDFGVASLARCRVCGCTDDDCRICIQRTGRPCHWVEPDLCSACDSTFPASPVAGSEPRPSGSVCNSKPQSKIENRQVRDAARVLRGIGLREASRVIAASIDTGMTALAAVKEPATITVAVGALEDGYRTMLVAASKGDRSAFKQAVATIVLWWDRMPQRVHNNIDFQVDAWRSESPSRRRSLVARRKVGMLLNAWKREPVGFRSLRTAMRIQK